MISFFGIVHQSGGCGPELLGAIELLRSKNVPVRLIVPPQDTEFAVGSNTAANYLASLGVDLVVYQPGLFKTCPVLMSFAEGLKLFPLMREHNDRPAWSVYSDCMWFPCDTEIDAYREGLIDEFFFQTKRVADYCGPQIARRTQRAVRGRHGYKAFINTKSEYLPIRFVLERRAPLSSTSQPLNDSTFTVLKVARDHEEKWHPDTWRMFCGVNAPSGTKVQIEIAGWGPESAKKTGDISDPANPWHKQIDVQLHSHVNDPVEMAEIYARSHVLIHVCDYEWEEAMSRVMLEAIASGVVVISDRRGGALDLIKHGETGYLVDTPDEAAYYASHLAFNPQLRKSIAGRAHSELVRSGHASADVCFHWWADLIKKTSSRSTSQPLNPSTSSP